MTLETLDKLLETTRTVPLSELTLSAQELMRKGIPTDEAMRLGQLRREISTKTIPEAANYILTGSGFSMAEDMVGMVTMLDKDKIKESEAIIMIVEAADELTQHGVPYAGQSEANYHHLLGTSLGQAHKQANRTLIHAIHHFNDLYRSMAGPASQDYIEAFQSALKK